MFDVLKHILPPTDADADADSQRWAARRRGPRAADSALTGTARQWLRRLPARRRPLRMCRLYPRVVNRIAWCWADAAMTEQVLDDLLQDSRGGRQGFPAPAWRELQRLREFNTQQRVETQPEGFWEAVGRVVVG